MQHILQKIKEIYTIFKDALKEWNAPNPWRLSAILSYYAIIAMPGLIVIVITIVGFFFSEKGVQLQIEQELSGIIGKDAAGMINNMVQEATETQDSLGSTIFGIVTLLYGSTGVFFHLQRSFNDIWGVKQKPNVALKKIVIDRFFSFGMVIAIAFLLLVSLLLSTLLGILREWLLDFLPAETIYVFIVLNWFLSFLIIVTLFSIMFKYLPDIHIIWKPVIAGAILTAILFIISEYLLSYYFQQTNLASLYGAAGLLVIIMLWITYTGLIIFYGAAFIKVVSKKYNYEIQPTSLAERK